MMKCKLKYILCITLLLPAFLHASFKTSTAEPTLRHILIIHSYHQGMPWTDNVMKGLLSVLDTASPAPEIHVEYMDTKRHPPDEMAGPFADILKTKYSDTRIDTIIVSDNNALDFLIANKDELFPGVPAVFCGINNFRDEMLQGRTDFTGVVEALDVEGTIETALTVMPELNRFAVITDTTPTGRANRRIFEEESTRFRGRADFEILDDITEEELKLRLSALDRDTGVLLFTFHRDKSGRLFSLSEYLGFITRTCDRPVFSFWDHYLPWGVVGGSMVYGVSQGEKAAEAALDILSGTPVSDIPVIRKSPNVPMFNYDQMKRFNIPLNRVPDNSIVLHPPDTFWERHVVELTAGLSVMVMMAFTLIYMVFKNLKQRKMEQVLRAGEEALTKSEERLQLALDAANYGLWDWNVADDRLYFSPRWYTMLGYEPYEFPSSRKTWADLVHPEDLEASEKVMKAHLKSGKPFQMEFRMRTKDGKFSWILSRGKTAARDASGAPLRMIGIHADITRRKHFEKSLTEARDAAEEANHIKNEFLANMSHEVRTPLNGIMGMLQLLQTTLLNKEQNEYTENALISGKRLTRLLSDILDLSRIDAGKLSLNREQFDVHDTMESLEALFTPSAKQKGLALDFKIAPDTPSELIGDVVRLQQVLSNIIGNALKFTDRGNVEVEVSPLFRDKNGLCRILFIVTDTGIGIEEDQVDILFEHFTQGARGFTRQYQGAGLGLTISRRITDLMGGSISVESTPGQGTRFYISLPFENARITKAKPDPELPVHDMSKLRVLVAEDDEITALATVKILEKMGHTIQAAKDGRQALDLLKKEPCDLVLMDIQMPVMDGVEATRAVRRGEAGRDVSKIPIIAMTAYAMSGDRENFLNAGMTDYIAKPVEVAKLREVLTTAASHIHR